MSEERTAWGWGLASVDAAGTTLDVWYPELNLGEAPAESDRPNHNFGTLAHDEADARGIRRVPVFVVSQFPPWAVFPSSASWTSRSVMPRTLT